MRQITSKIHMISEILSEDGLIEIAIICAVMLSAVVSIVAMLTIIF